MRSTRPVRRSVLRRISSKRWRCSGSSPSVGEGVLHGASNEREGRAQLVADVGEEVGLGDVELGQDLGPAALLLEVPDAAQGHGDVGGTHLGVELEHRVPRLTGVLGQQQVRGGLDEARLDDGHDVDRPTFVVDGSRHRVARRGPPEVTLEVVVVVRAEHVEGATTHVLGILGVGQGGEKSGGHIGSTLGQHLGRRLGGDVEDACDRAGARRGRRRRTT